MSEKVSKMQWELYEPLQHWNKVGFVQRVVTAYSKGVSVTWRWGTVFPRKMNSRVTLNPCLTEGTACSSFIFTHAFIFYFHILKSTGKISWNYILLPFSIQFPILLLDALSQFSLFQSREVESRSGWPIQEHFILSKTAPLTPHQKNGHSEKQIPLRPMTINHGVKPVSHPRHCSPHLHTHTHYILSASPQLNWKPISSI